MTDELSDMLEAEISSDGHRAYPPPNPNYPNALFNREKLNANSGNQCMNDKGVSQKFISDLQQKMVVGQVELIRGIASKSNYEITSEQNTFELLSLLTKSKLLGQTEKDKLTSLINKLTSNPVLEKFAKSNEVFYKIFTADTSQDVDDVFKEYKKSKEDEKQIISDLQAKCGAVFSAYEKAFCVSSDDALMPIEKPESMKNRLLGGEFSDQSSVANIMQTSSILTDNYCIFSEDKVSHFSEVSKIVSPSIHQSIKGIKSFTDASDTLYEQSTKELGNKLCKHLPPKMNTLKIAMEEKGCSGNVVTDDPDCGLFDAANKTIQATYGARKVQITDKVELAAKERGITDKTQIAQMVKDAVDNIDTKEIMSAYSDYNSVPKGNSALLNRFLGQTNVGNDQAVKISSTGVSSNSVTGGDVETDSDEQQLTGASLSSSSRVVDYQASLPQNKYAVQARENTQKGMDDFYSEVARRVTNVKSDPVHSVGSGVGTQVSSVKRRTATEKLFDALPAPTSSSSVEDSSSTNLASNDYSNEAYGTGAISESIGSDYQTDNTIATGVETPTNNWNDALGDKYKANEASKLAELNKGKIPASPFAKELAGVGKKNVGASGESSGAARSVASGNGSSFLGGGGSASMPINPDEFLPGIDQLIDGVYLEKQRGLEGQNTEHAEFLLELLGGKTRTVTLKNKENEKHEVQIIKQGDSLKLVRLGNMADEKYSSFVSKIENTIIRYNNVDYNENFNSLLQRLKSAVDSKTGIPEPEESAVRLDQFVGR